MSEASFILSYSIFNALVLDMMSSVPLYTRIKIPEPDLSATTNMFQTDRT